jgi:predicted esterase
MVVEKIQIKVSKTARLILMKSETQVNAKLIIALHGYGQLCTYFSRKFEGIHKDFDVLVPEGLNRFYLKASSGRVGSSWMTKEEREMDILDNQTYLHELVNDYSKKYDSILLLGFSQGGATASRFCYQMQAKIDGLILWGSVFPPDISQEETTNFTGQKFFVLGKQDEYFSFENQKEVLALQNNLGYKTVQFEGGHDVDITILNDILHHF